MDAQPQDQGQLGMVGTVLNWSALVLSGDSRPSSGLPGLPYALPRQVPVPLGSNPGGLQRKWRLVAAGPSILQLRANH